MNQSLPKNLFKELHERLELFKKILSDFGQTNYTFDQYEKIFSNYGWYIPSNLLLKDLTILINQFENNEIEKANMFLVKYFKNEFKMLQNKLVKSFPERSNILNEAFHAHRKKMFYSSTILFLSQADGITENNIFMGTNFRKFIIENEKHPLVNLFREKNPLTIHFNKDSQNNTVKNNLNRHGIMHGLSHNYGSELNSFKSLSFLMLLSDLKNKIP